MLDQTSMKHDLLERKIKSVQEEKRSGDFYAWRGDEFSLARREETRGFLGPLCATSETTWRIKVQHLGVKARRDTWNLLKVEGNGGGGNLEGTAVEREVLKTKDWTWRMACLITNLTFVLCSSYLFDCMIWWRERDGQLWLVHVSSSILSGAQRTKDFSVTWSVRMLQRSVGDNCQEVTIPLQPPGAHLACDRIDGRNLKKYIY